MPEPAKSLATMSGKTCLVTGATAGIGLVTARELARRGARVILVGRNRAKCETTAAGIRDDTGNSTVEFLVADLSSQEEIRRLAAEVRERCPRLDVLVNNAGAMYDRRRETVDGFEMTWALNHLAYFLLTSLLLDTLKSSAPARVVNVASNAHGVAPRLDFDDPQAKNRYRAFRVYGHSKLANILFTQELARRLGGTGVTANCLHPGFVATDFTAGNGWLGWAFRIGARLIAIAPDEGAKTSIYLASSPDVEGISGEYFDKCKVAVPSAAARDTEAARRLWRLSEEMTGVPVTA